MKLSPNLNVFINEILTKLSSKVHSSPSLSREFNKAIYFALCVCSVSNMPVYNLTNKHPELINKSSGFFQRVLQCVGYRIENILEARFHSYTVSMQVSNLNSKSLLYQENITPAIVSVGAIPHVHACRALLAILLICTLRTLDIYDKGCNFYLFSSVWKSMIRHQTLNAIASSNSLEAFFDVDKNSIVSNLPRFCVAVLK